MFLNISTVQMISVRRTCFRSYVRI